MYTPGCRFEDLRPGDTFPGMFVDHIASPIYETLYDEETGKPTVKTAYGNFVFNHGEPIVFPRRLDGRTINWMNDMDVDPVPEHLAIGDILRPNLEIPALTGNPQLDSRQQSFYALHKQIVIRLYRKSRNSDTYILKTSAPGHIAPNDSLGRGSHFTYLVFKGKPIKFPHELYSERRTPREHEGYELAGPYVWENVPDAELWFYIHKTGRGRWPRHLQEFIPPNAPGTYQMRPPTSYADWTHLRYTGESGKRHPSDLTSERRSVMYREYVNRTRPPGQ